jgi:hypothetical protein
MIFCCLAYTRKYVPILFPLFSSQFISFVVCLMLSQRYHDIVRYAFSPRPSHCICQILSCCIVYRVNRGLPDLCESDPRFVIKTQYYAPAKQSALTVSLASPDTITTSASSTTTPTFIKTEPSQTMMISSSPRGQMKTEAGTTPTSGDRRRGRGSRSRSPKRSARSRSQSRGRKASNGKSRGSRDHKKKRSRSRSTSRSRRQGRSRSRERKSSNDGKRHNHNRDHSTKVTTTSFSTTNEELREVGYISFSTF